MSLVRYLPIMWIAVAVVTAIFWRTGLMQGFGASLTFSFIPIIWFFIKKPEQREFVTDYNGPSQLIAVFWVIATIGHYLQH